MPYKTSNNCIYLTNLDTLTKLLSKKHRLYHFIVPVGTYRSFSVLCGLQVVFASWDKVAPAMFLCIMQRKTIPCQAHQLGCHPHLQADQSGSRRPVLLLRHLHTQFPVPAKRQKCQEVKKWQEQTQSVLCLYSRWVSRHVLSPLRQAAHCTL